MTGDANIPFNLLIVPASLVIVGVLVARNARRRKGIVPHCAKCDYVLFGNESQVCPECGESLTPQAIVRGERCRTRPYWIGLVLAALNLCVIAALLAPCLIHYDWYRWRPLSWVIRDAGSRQVTLAQRAWDEVERRRKVNRFSDSDEQQLSQFALVEQSLAFNVSATPSPILDRLLDSLRDRCLGGKLSDAQTHQFLEHCIRIDVRVRAQVLAGERYPVEINPVNVGPRDGIFTQMMTQTLTVGTNVRQVWNDPGGFGEGFGMGTITYYDYAPSPGDYPVTVTSTLRASASHPNVWSSETKSVVRKPIHQWTTTTKQTLHVIPKDADKRFKLLHKPELQSAMESAISISNTNYLIISKEPAFAVHYGPLPENIAFEVFARANGIEYPIGEIAEKKGASGTHFLYPKLDKAQADKFDVIFRSSPTVARQTIDLFDIWDGQIIVKDVPFNVKTPAK